MFLLTERPHLYPAVTLLGNAQGPVVDTGIDILTGGRVYIDRVEAGEIARLFDFETPEAAQRRTQRIAALEEEVADYKRRLARLRDIVDEHTTG
jgi:hypothetical protein